MRYVGAEDFQAVQERPKRYQNKPEQIAHLKKVLVMLKGSGIVPKEYKPHMLMGEYKDHMECHIENDTF